MKKEPCEMCNAPPTIYGTDEKGKLFDLYPEMAGQLVLLHIDGAPLGHYLPHFKICPVHLEYLKSRVPN